MTSIFPLRPLNKDIPELENGDRLNSQEFLRRYENMPEGVHAELIEGIVYMNAAAVRYRPHGMPQNIVQFVMTYYAFHTPGVECCSPSSTILDADNTYEPDVILRIRDDHGGNSFEGEDDYLHGPPELVAEIAASSVRRDAHLKKHAYERLGIHEYLLWRTEDEQIDWFSACDGQYVPISADAEGNHRSVVYPGLWLNFELLRQHAGRAALALLERGLKSPEHAEFVTHLGQVRDRRE